jgi:hypothetical protein
MIFKFKNFCDGFDDSLRMICVKFPLRLETPFVLKRESQNRSPIRRDYGQDCVD